jgi:1,5-anhydro-D-fructose reductase (1,5-anhydro-D-mannitol-forming)
MSAIRWGFIGATTIGREWMVEAIREAGGMIRAVMSRDAARGKAYASEFGIPKSTTNLASLWADVDAVYIATTNERHREECVAAAEASKHVLCEKPLATGLEDARAMVEACKRAGVVMGVNHHLRNAATHRAIRDAIKSGRIGRPLAARVVHGGSLPEHLRTWRLQDSSGGGGAIMDLTVHDGDLLRFLLSDEPESVSAFAQNGGLAAPGVEDAAVIQLRFASGLIAQLHDSFTTPYLRTTVEVHGTEGSITALDCMPQRPGGTVSIRTAGGEEQLKLAHENYYVRGIRAFHEAVAGRGQPVCTGEDGVRSLAIALAARRSVESGRVEAIESL